ncbi:MAG: SMP-30/gluconolactonase/LRE family protein [Alphaproteobacteria bacterium]|jgi:gluconolactonase|nr:SMP-30/gluconolactonase/LRE family protein [Alphaproteobacteria bacterium]MDP6814676.1 SMP-30/gluconolactonase/LRE family protein [Alphaproteobacteria bacterium]
MSAIREVATGLRFPEGPVALPNGDVLVVEIARGTLSRVLPDGRIEVVAETGGGPNGAAIGPDGACYICNNGGFRWHEKGPHLFPGFQAEDYAGGRIERVDLDTGEVEVLYRDCDGAPLCGPNDIVFDADGGFWFTDHGKFRHRDRDRTGVYYARADGSSITEAIFPVDTPNGVGLSPDEETLYVAETHACRLWAYQIAGPGQVVRGQGEAPWEPGRLLMGAADYRFFDSLAVDGGGNICVGTIVRGGITVIAPEGGEIEHLPTPGDRYATNICFGGPDLRTAYITLSSTGKLVAMDWPRPGLPLNFLNK